MPPAGAAARAARIVSNEIPIVFPIFKAFHEFCQGLPPPLLISNADLLLTSPWMLRRARAAPSDPARANYTIFHFTRSRNVDNA